MDGLTPGERRLRAKLAANARWSRTEDRFAATAPARRGLRRKFELQVDPDGTLSEAERARRAEMAWKAHFQRLSLRSAQNNRRKRQAAAPQPDDGAA